MNTIRALTMVVLASVVGCATATCWVNPFEAIEAGDVQALQRYLDAGGSVGLTDPERGSLMFMAVMLERNDIAKLLIDKGANILVEPSGMSIPLEVAVVEERIEILKAMLDSCSYCVNRWERGYTPLMIAAGEGAAESVKLLLERGADASALSASKVGKPEPRTALHYAIVQQHFEIAETLAAVLDQKKVILKRCGPEAEVAADVVTAESLGKTDIAENLKKYCQLGDG